MVWKSTKNHTVKSNQLQQSIMPPNHKTSLQYWSHSTLPSHLTLISHLTTPYFRVDSSRSHQRLPRSHPPIPCPQTSTRRYHHQLMLRSHALIPYSHSFPHFDTSPCSHAIYAPVRPQTPTPIIFYWYQVRRWMSISGNFFYYRRGPLYFFYSIDKNSGPSGKF